MIHDSSRKTSYQLIAARAISFLGSGIYATCFPLYILQETSSLTTAGLFFGLTYLPSVLLLPFLGVWMERWKLINFLVSSDTFSTILFLLLLGSLSIFGFSIVWFSGLTILFHINDSMFQVASNSIFVHIVDKEQLERTNGIKSTFDNLSTLLAPLLATTLYALFGFSIILLINALSFLISALLMSRMKVAQQPTMSTSNTSYKRQLSEGIQYITQHKSIFYLFLLIMGLNFLCSPMEEIFTPGILQVKYQFSAVSYGSCATSISLGVILASVYLGFKKRTTSVTNLRPYFLMQGMFMILMGTSSLLLYSFPHSIFLTCYLLLCFLCGIMMTFVNVPLLSSFQSMVSSHMQARFFSLLSFFSKLMIPFGTFVAGASSSLFGADIAYMINGCFILLLILIVYHKIKNLELGNPKAIKH